MGFDTVHKDRKEEGLSMKREERVERNKEMYGNHSVSPDGLYSKASRRSSTIDTCAKVTGFAECPDHVLQHGY